MPKLLASLVAALGFTGLAVAQRTEWPRLPATDFVAGRAANREDVQAGRAVFVAQRNGVQLGKPIPIQIPQFAWHKEPGKKTPVVIIQAEEANGQRIIGAKTLSGSYMAGLFFEFELLGTSPPK